MRRLIDADALKRDLVKNGFRNDVDMMMTLETINNAPTIDAVPLDGSFLKMSKSDYLIYNRHWLYEHFDMEMEIQRSAMKSMGYEPALKDAQPHWIPCSEMLPESDKNVLVQLKDCDVDPILIMSLRMCGTEDGWWAYWKTQEESLEFELDEIIAWQPLPEPYHEADHE